jgi:hypothetical protein
MFCNSNAGASREKCSGGGDVERRHGATAGAAGVDELIGLRSVEFQHHFTQRPHDARNNFRRLAAHSQSGEHCSDLHRGGLSTHYHAECLRCVVG